MRGRYIHTFQVRVTRREREWIERLARVRRMSVEEHLRDRSGLRNLPAAQVEAQTPERHLQLLRGGER
jgi:hypothetical protein